jgi:TetR/AcrR family transcriptional regulator
MGIAERKEREREQRRNEIIDAAEIVFFSKGLANASMDEVASKAELSKGTIYLYFKSKEELLFAINLRSIKILQEKFEAVTDPGKSTIDNILEIAKSYVRFSRDYHDYFKMLLYFEDDTLFKVDHALYKELCSQGGDPICFLIRMLEKGIHDGSIRRDITPAILAHCLWSQITGILRLAKIMDFHIDLNDYSEDDLIDAHIKIVLNGILKES